MQAILPVRWQAIAERGIRLDHRTYAPAGEDSLDDLDQDDWEAGTYDRLD
ncbi:hypothetical protein ACFU6I_16015 [Streptomyces sp. NPDC057486]